jgi:hypothetical protein
MAQVYSGNFLKSLKPKAERQYQKFKDRFDIEKVRAAKTLGNQLTSPLCSIFI